MKYKISIALALLLIFGIAVGNIYIRQKSRDDAYNNAVALILNGSYEDALSELEKANPDKIERKKFERDMRNNSIEKPYKNSLVLYAYALAQNEFNSEPVYFYVVNNYLKLISADYDGELSLEIKGFKEKFKPLFDEFLAEQERIAEEKRIKEKKEKEEREREIKDYYKNILPQVGMEECYINYTLMGDYHDYENIVVGKGKSYEYTKTEYRWRHDSGKTILCVTCRDGKVIEVSKSWENKYWTADGKPIFSGTRAGYKASTGGKKKVYNDDTYNVNDYYDAEDFYDDYYDDFYEYEEAEDYFNEHREW